MVLKLDEARGNVPIFCNFFCKLECMEIGHVLQRHWVIPENKCTLQWRGLNFQTLSLQTLIEKAYFVHLYISQGRRSWGDGDISPESLHFLKWGMVRVIIPPTFFPRVKFYKEDVLTLKWPRYFYSRWCPRGVPIGTQPYSLNSRALFLSLIDLLKWQNFFRI